MIKILDIYKAVVSNKFSFSKEDFKYFIGHKNGKKFRPLCMLLPKWMHIEEILTKLNLFLSKHNELLEKYNEI